MKLLILTMVSLLLEIDKILRRKGLRYQKMFWDFLKNIKKPESLGSECALLILNQPILISKEIMTIIWNNATFRLLVDGGSNRWLSFLRENDLNDMKLPDLISGDFDSIKPETQKYFEEKNVTFVSTPDQDETDFTKALRCILDLSKDKNPAIKMVFVVCETAGRLDQIIGNLNTLHSSAKFLQNIPVINFSSKSISWVLRTGTHVIIIPEEFIQHEFYCGLLPLSGPTRLTTFGFKWNLNDQTMQFGGLISTSNTYTEGKVIVANDGDLVFSTQYAENDN